MNEGDYNWIPTYGVGSYGGLDDRQKSRKRKQPIGFAPPKLKPQKRKPRPK